MKPDQIHSGVVYLGADGEARKVLSVKGSLTTPPKKRIVEFRASDYRPRIVTDLESFAAWAVSEKPVSGSRVAQG